MSTFARVRRLERRRVGLEDHRAMPRERREAKSTEPKTRAGKEESRRYALKHGLSGAGVVMRRTDEKKLVERAALGAVGCESAIRQQAVERRRRIRRALSRLEAQERKKLNTGGSRTTTGD